MSKPKKAKKAKKAKQLACKKVISKYSAEQIKQFWEKYISSRESGMTDTEAEKALLEYYYPLVVKVASRQRQKLTEVTQDELTSMGVDGLYDALSKYDSSYKNTFNTYATHRIKGSMLDAIRKVDWVPRLVRSRNAWLEKKRGVLESAAGKKLTNAELAKQLGYSNEDFEDIATSASSPAVLSVNDMMDEDRSRCGPGSILQAKDEKCSQPVDDMIRKEIFSKLFGKHFTKQEKQIMWEYYFQNKSMKEIALSVELSESRVSQLHGEMLKRLKQKVERNPEYFSDILSMVSRFKGLQVVES